MCAHAHAHKIPNLLKMQILQTQIDCKWDQPQSTTAFRQPIRDNNVSPTAYQADVHQLHTGVESTTTVTMFLKVPFLILPLLFLTNSNCRQVEKPLELRCNI